jgi:serine/threonine-protein kinase
MGRKSAIKVMTQNMANDPDAVSRFNREASNASRLSHPNICQIYDFGETSDGLIYLAMEFIEGRSLSALAEAEGALPPQRAASIVKQAAEALQVAHDQAIVHRDIKPDNIMIVQAKDGSDLVKVVDFGIAKAMAGDETGQKVTKTGLVVGTPEYMSPEQLSGDKIDGRSDLYSLALVCYKLLTGVLPFQADTSQETMIKRLTDAPEPLATARPDIVFPPRLQAVMDRALARSLTERDGSAAEFGRDLEASVGGPAVPATRMDVMGPSAATQLMDADAALKMVRKDKAGAPEAAAPAKKFPVVPVVGGVGVVGVLAVVAVLALGPKKPSAAPGADSTASRTGQTAATPGNQQNTAAPNPQTPQGQNLNRQTPPGNARQVAANPPPGNPAPTGGGNWADTLQAANDAFDADQFDNARRLGSAVFAAPGAPAMLKARGAMVVATALTQQNNVDRALDWYRNALRYETDAQRIQRIRQAIIDLGGTP